MKKFLKTMIVAILVLSMTLSMAGCISSDWTKVKKNLENEDYAVDHYTSESMISLTIAGWTALGGNFDDIDVEKVKCLLIGERNGKVIYIAFCDDLETANRFEEDFDDWLDVLDDNRILDDDAYETEQNFKVAYLGHKDAIKAAR